MTIQRQKYKHIMISMVLIQIILSCNSFAAETGEKYGDYPAIKDDIKIHFFLEASTVPGDTARGMVPYFDSQSYFLGIIDSYKAMQTDLPTEKHFCIPDSFTMNEFITILAKRYKNWDFQGNPKASFIMLELLQKEFPCNNVNTK